MVEAIQCSLSAAVVALHHTGHGNQGHARGSSVFGADADVVIALDRPNLSEYVVSLEMQKQKDAAIWGQEKWLKLHEIHLSTDIKSLVPMNHIPLKKTGEKEQVTTKLFLIGLTDSILYDILKENPSRVWTAKDLSVAISTDDRMRGKATWDTITGYLETIRETESGYKSILFFDSKGNKTLGKWAWKS